MLNLVEKRSAQARFGELFPEILNENRLVDSLECYQTLKGHIGCVNTLRWNKYGTTLASGSDDRCIKIWRAGSHRHTIETGHEGNVFAVEFLPSSNDKKIVSGAADQIVFLHDIETGEKRKWEMSDRVKRMATLEQDPTLFWAAVESEDGVHQFDTRLERSECVVSTSHLDSSNSAKSLAVSEAQPHLMAVGFDETPVRIYDRRNFREEVLTCAPLDAANYAYHATHVAFNKTGTEIVVNHGAGGHVYVFPLIESKNPKFMDRLNAVFEKSGEPTIVSQNLPHAAEREEGSTLIRTKKFSRAVDFYSDLIVRSDPDRAFHSVCHSNRGTALLARRQRGDTYACVRDCVKALEIHRGNSKALFRLIKSFTTMEKPVLATRCIEKFREWYPEDQVPGILKMEVDVSQIKDDHRRPQLEAEPGTVDYLHRFVGGANYQTDIKEANFFGSRDQYIVAGSDCGHMFIWNRDTCKIQGVWKADNHILNIVQPHPNQFLLASSGIDDDIRIWQPLLERPEDVEFETSKETDHYQFLEERHDGNREQYMSIRELARYGQCTQS